MKKKQTYNIVIAGAGYVGMANACLLAQKHMVTIFEVDDTKIEKINKRESIFSDDLITQFFDEKALNLKAQFFEKNKILEADFIIVCLPTNYDEVKKEFNTIEIEKFLTEVSKVSLDTPIIIKSTVPVGFTDKMSKYFNLRSIYFCPEFLREGKALRDCLYPDRLIIGSNNAEATEFLEILEDMSNKLSVHKIFTSNTTTELIKLASNAYLALRVTFFNELDSLAIDINKEDENLVEVEKLVYGLSLDPRIAEGYNNPSFGFGGYCLPKDTKQLSSTFERYATCSKLIASITDANEARVMKIMDEIQLREPKTVGVYRLEMKKGSDNSRESINLLLTQMLIREGYKVEVYEPVITISNELSNFLNNDLQSFLNNNDLIIANRWENKILKYRDKVMCRDILNEN